MSERGLRIAFMGTPDFAAAALENLAKSRHEIVCVYSQPPRPKGRGQAVQRSAVHELADSRGIPVRTPKNFKDAADIQAFKALNLDAAVVAAYGLILPGAVLDAPKYGCINIHASLLPRWRGAAPIQRAILAGDSETGISIMQMDEGLDTGPVIAARTVAIRRQTTAQSLHDELAALGSAMIEDVLDDLADGKDMNVSPQPETGSTYAKMLTKDEGRIDWGKNAAEIDRQIRALNPWPGTWCEANGRRLKILEAVPGAGSASPGTVLSGGEIACGTGSLKLLSVQPEGKKPMDAASALNGGYFKAGERLK